MKNTIDQRVSLVGTIWLHVKLGNSRARVVFISVRNLALPVLVETSYIDRFFKGSFPPERKSVPYNAKPVSNIAIKDMPEEHNSKAKIVTFIE